MMKILNRPKFPRLPSYDYSSSGGYFVTLCTSNRECSLGVVIDDHVELSAWGVIAKLEWERSATIRKEICLDAFVIMPNHLHGIVFLVDSSSSHCRARLPQNTHQRKPQSLGSFIAGFKAFSTKRINEFRGTPRQRFWQPDYYEHVIRNDEDLQKIREYITNNPLQWASDNENPDKQ